MKINGGFFYDNAKVSYQRNALRLVRGVVQKALSAVAGAVSATVTLRPAEALITSQEPLDARALNAAV
jgi:hypothetical protein